jgi:hypothetical protein
MKKQARTRHFPYKHPTFGSKSKPKPKSAWEGSVYYWWWAYLRRNQEYLDCCNNRGKGRLKSLYENFGDVRGEDFKEWWQQDVNGEQRGAFLFANKRAEDSIRVLSHGEKAVSNDEALTISLPLNLPKRFLERRVLELIASNHKGERGHQYARNANAKFKIQGQPNVPALALGMQIYEFKLQHPDFPLWKIGNEIPKVLRTQKISSRDQPYELLEKKRALAATVSRYLKRVELTIARTIQGEGLFP